MPFPLAGNSVRFPQGRNCSATRPNKTIRATAAELSAEHGQHRMLSEICRVLKPCGIVQLNTKNGFSYRLIIGGRDEHCHGMRFGSALPRWLLRRFTAWSFALVWCASAAGSACWLISDFNLLGCSRNAV